MNRLVEEYTRIAGLHAEVDRYFFARATLGSSVIRVFERKSKPVIMRALLKLDIRDLQPVRSEVAYRWVFEEQLEHLAQAIRRCNRNNNRIKPGLKWGHATKILCLFHRDMVVHSRYFNMPTADRLSRYLYAPIDNIVLERLVSLGSNPAVSGINGIDTKAKFYKIQSDLGSAAKKVKVPRVWFDDNWGDRQ